MDLNEKTRALLAGLPELAMDGAIDWPRLTERDHPVFVMRNLDPVRRWLGIPDLLKSIRPSPEFLAVLLGHGRAGALRFDRAAALFAKNEIRHKRVTATSQSVADES